MNSVHTPLLNNKDEIQAGLNYKFSEFLVATIEPEASFAITDHIGVMYSGSYAFKNSGNIEPGSLYNKRYFSEIGIGYFDKFADDWQYEVYGGYGYGKINDRYKDDDDETITSNSATYGRYFIQPTIAYVLPYFNIAFTPRIVAVNYIESKNGTGNFTAIEPVFSFQAGKKLVFQAQAGVSYYLNNFKGAYNPLIISFGLKYRFNRKQ